MVKPSAWTVRSAWLRGRPLQIGRQRDLPGGALGHPLAQHLRRDDVVLVVLEQALPLGDIGLAVVADGLAVPAHRGLAAGVLVPPLETGDWRNLFESLAVRADELVADRLVDVHPLRAVDELAHLRLGRH